MTTSHKLFLSTGIIISIFAALTINAITTNSSAQGISSSNTSSEDQNSTCSPIYMNKSANTTSRNLSEANSLPGFHAFYYLTLYLCPELAFIIHSDKRILVYL